MSSLIGLRRTLKWDDFKGTPPPGTNFSAQTASDFTVSNPTFQNVAGRKVQRVDQLILTVVFDEKKSWKVPMNNWSLQKQQDLLDHEQGHYDITALIARDLFIRLMGGKNKVYNDKAEGVDDIAGLKRIYKANEKKAQDQYDDDTMNSQANTFQPSVGPPPTKGSTQAKWERVIASGFTTVRPSGDTAPDGTPYKVELMEILVKAGMFPQP
jgi:hypothetical protein